MILIFEINVVSRFFISCLLGVVFYFFWGGGGWTHFLFESPSPWVDPWVFLFIFPFTLVSVIHLNTTTHMMQVHKFSFFKKKTFFSTSLFDFRLVWTRLEVEKPLFFYLRHFESFSNLENLRFWNFTH